MYPEDEKISEIEARIDRVQGVIARSGGRRSHAERRIKEIQQELPSVTFQAAMGELDDDTPDRLRQKMLSLQCDIDDHVHIVEEGRKASIRLNGEMTKLRMARSRRVEYDEIKQQISDDPEKLSGGALVRTGMFLSESLHGDKSDFEQFMTLLQKGATA